METYICALSGGLSGVEVRSYYLDIEAENIVAAAEKFKTKLGEYPTDIGLKDNLKGRILQKERELAALKNKTEELKIKVDIAWKDLCNYRP